MPGCRAGIDPMVPEEPPPIRDSGRMSPMVPDPVEPGHTIVQVGVVGVVALAGSLFTALPTSTPAMSAARRKTPPTICTAIEWRVMRRGERRVVIGCPFGGIRR